MRTRYKVRHPETGKEAWTLSPLTWTEKGGRAFPRHRVASLPFTLQDRAARKQVDQEMGLQKGEWKRPTGYWERLKVLTQSKPVVPNVLVVPLKGIKELEAVELAEFLAQPVKYTLSRLRRSAPAIKQAPTASTVVTPTKTPSNASWGLNVSQLLVCHQCCKVIGPIQRWHGKVYQGCRCYPTAYAGPQSFVRPPEHVFADAWPGLDFSEAVTLCYCCGTVPLESGKRFSRWFCKDCEARVSRVNQEWLAVIFPVGRHSFMNGVGLRGRDAGNQQKLDAFLERAGGLWDGQAKLYQWAPLAVKQNLQATGLDCGENVALTDYLEACATIPNAKQEAFSRLLKFFQVEV